MRQAYHRFQDTRENQKLIDFVISHIGNITKLQHFKSAFIHNETKKYFRIYSLEKTDYSYLIGLANKNRSLTIVTENICPLGILIFFEWEPWEFNNARFYVSYKNKRTFSIYSKYMLREKNYNTEEKVLSWLCQEEGYHSDKLLVTNQSNIEEVNSEENGNSVIIPQKMGFIDNNSENEKIEISKFERIKLKNCEDYFLEVTDKYIELKGKNSSYVQFKISKDTPHEELKTIESLINHAIIKI